MERQFTLQEANAELGNRIYKAAIFFEQLENDGLILGNGHYIARCITQYAQDILKQHWNKSEFEEEKYEELNEIADKYLETSNISVELPKPINRPKDVTEFKCKTFDGSNDPDVIGILTENRILTDTSLDIHLK